MVSVLDEINVGGEKSANAASLISGLLTQNSVGTTRFKLPQSNGLLKGFAKGQTSAETSSDFVELEPSLN